MNFIKKNYPYIILGLSVLLLLWRSLYGFCWSDEAFYLGITNRFYQGDIPLMDEWHPSQLQSLINVPFYALYIAITGSTDGVYLFFRIFYVILEGLTAVFTYKLLKKSASSFTSLLIAMFVLYYTHLNIATTSYYTISVLSFVMVCVLIYSYRDTKSKVNLIIAGFLFALCVLSLAPMAAGYILMIIIAAVSFIFCKNQTLKKEIKDIFLYTLIGIAIPAVIFFIYLFCNMSVSKLIESLGYVFTDDEHPNSFNLTYPIRKFFFSVRDVFGNYGYIWFLCIPASFVYGCLIRDGLFKVIKIKETIIRKLDKFVSICFFLLELSLLIIGWPKTIPNTGYIQSALCLATTPVFFLCQKRDWRKAICFIAPGYLFAMVYSYSSDNFLHILAMGHFIALLGNILCIEDYFKEVEDVKVNKVFGLVTALIIVCGLIQTMSLRMWNVYRDAPIPTMTAKIICGPAKGIYTHPEHEKQYMDVFNTMKEYGQAENAGDTILISKLLPWAYLCTDSRCAGYTVWRIAMNSERIKDYWTLEPDREADKILVLNEEYGSFYACGDVLDDFNPNLNETGGYLKEYVDANDFTVIEVPCGLLYTKNVY